MRQAIDVLMVSDPRGQYTLVNVATREPLASPFYSLPDVALVAQSIANLRNVQVWSQAVDHAGQPIGEARLFAPLASRVGRGSAADSK